MARPSSVDGLKEILGAAEHWKNNCLLADGSVFTDAHLWSAENVDLLDRYFVQNPQPGSAGFSTKFRTQLEPAPLGVRQLAAEMLWILLLFQNNVTRKKEAAECRRSVVLVWTAARREPRVAPSP